MRERRGDGFRNKIRPCEKMRKIRSGAVLTKRDEKDMLSQKKPSDMTERAGDVVLHERGDQNGAFARQHDPRGGERRGSGAATAKTRHRLERRRAEEKKVERLRRALRLFRSNDGGAVAKPPHAGIDVAAQ